MSMRGISISEFGGPEVLQLKRNLTIPLPKQNQVLIRVRACNVSNQDISLRSGSTQTYQNRNNKNLDKPYTPGTEVSGFVEIVGENVTKLNVGDRVYSFNGCRTGGCAQFCVLDENDTFRLPEQLTLKQGACLGRSYFISYVSLVVKGGLLAGQNVLISLPWNSPLTIPMIQISTAAGAKSITLTKSDSDFTNSENPKIQALILSQSRPPTTLKIKETLTNENFELILDGQPNCSLNRTSKRIAKNGKIVILKNFGWSKGVCDDFEYDVIVEKDAKLVGCSEGFVRNLGKVEKERASFQIEQWIELGLISPVDAEEFSLDQTRDAHRTKLVASGPRPVVVIIES